MFSEAREGYLRTQPLLCIDAFICLVVLIDVFFSARTFFPSLFPLFCSLPAFLFSMRGCRYKMFVAVGREFKFFGDDFKCPECGAGKSKFIEGDSS